MIALSETSDPASLLAGPADERNASLSPDGRWISYQSNESGRFEICVRPFPNVEAELQVMVVPVQTGPTFGHENPRALLAWPYEWGNPGRSYDVSPDGRRFLVVKTLEFDDAQNAPVSTISFVLNWFEELKRLVPAN